MAITPRRVGRKRNAETCKASSHHTVLCLQQVTSAEGEIIRRKKEDLGLLEVYRLYKNVLGSVKVEVIED